MFTFRQRNQKKSSHLFFYFPDILYFLILFFSLGELNPLTFFKLITSEPVGTQLVAARPVCAPVLSKHGSGGYRGRDAQEARQPRLLQEPQGHSQF